jgi:predicted branched-subunit amino acid permease
VAPAADARLRGRRHDGGPVPAKIPVRSAASRQIVLPEGLLYPNWASWQIGSIAGIFLGSTVPAEWGLSFAGTLAIICVMIPLMVGRPALCGVLVAGAVSVLAAGLPYKLGLLLAVLVGMVTAMVMEETAEKWRSKRG